MSFANSIISSVNNKTKSNSSSIPQPIPPSNNEDIGFSKDIQTEMKDSISKPISKDINKPKKSKILNYSLFGIFNFISLPLTISIIIIILLLLNHNDFKLFGNLGNILDNIINYVFTLFKPIINNIQDIIFGTVNQASSNIAIGVKQSVNKTSDITDELTEPVIIDEEKIKINKKLNNEINSKKYVKNNDVENDNITSAIQKPSNWCFIGEDQGVRKCVKIGDNACMSQLVYSSENNCINNI